ncbi:hypothetical protein RRG08_008184 [Elysia crispata]|uniref:Uncharacterized protein n=1 Tax=Elysia crispata TaxID=231223 RepID=A0AAE1DUQ6_9GAST|nr:hypothetical protein RRG08_008184 [Elysia crispata]
MSPRPEVPCVMMSPRPEVPCVMMSPRPEVPCVMMSPRPEVPCVMMSPRPEVPCVMMSPRPEGCSVRRARKIRDIKVALVKQCRAQKVRLYGNGVFEPMMIDQYRPSTSALMTSGRDIQPPLVISAPPSPTQPSLKNTGDWLILSMLRSAMSSRPVV